MTRAPPGWRREQNTATVVSNQPRTASMAISPIRILIINPNTSQHMTDGLRPAIDGLNYTDVVFEYFTSPEPGIPSINSPADAKESASICLPKLIPLIPHHDAFLVACYSEHPLVHQLHYEIDKLAQNTTSSSDSIRQGRKFVMGIFEASVTASLNLIGNVNRAAFGIVSTGKIWEQALDSAVTHFLAHNRSLRFAGCKTTGLNASELHDLPVTTVKEKMKHATKELIVSAESQNPPIHVRAICLGCAGMVGLDEAVREACIEQLGDVEGRSVAIVDGVKAGVGILVALSKCGLF